MYNVRQKRQIHPEISFEETPKSRNVLRNQSVYLIATQACRKYEKEEK
jgi:hypothetical protein